ncbi:hypothetical protein PIB30_066966 [Stylosanthes scabra]|uniref:Uncharacterized protein n=1 Tax=Stylosanthes scabra TaxID=79078 RepID=A0ABU6VPW6_9FABA|nr:hypothetical protein [Stylosanthes scabra]
MEKELSSMKDQVDVLTAKRDSVLAAPLLNAKIKSLVQKLKVTEGERLSALARITEVEEGARVQAAQLESCRSALERERKEVENLAQSLKEKQTVLDEAKATAAHWRDEWKSLAEETGEMVQETFEILMDQVRHLNPAIDYSMISLDTRWDPKAKRIYNPKAEAQEQSEPAAEERLDPAAGVLLGEGDQGELPEGPAGDAVVEEVASHLPGDQSGVERRSLGRSAFGVALWVIFVPLYIRAPGLFDILFLLQKNAFTFCCELFVL